jgi:hypothetical protein
MDYLATTVEWRSKLADSRKKGEGEGKKGILKTISALRLCQFGIL